MNLELTGKTALITGASKGIGRASAECLAREGCNLHLAARTEADLARAADELRDQYRVEVRIHPADLGISQNVIALASACKDIDILVNNAGAIPGASITSADETTWRNAWDLKVFGYINLIRAIYPALAARGGGVIINVIGAGGEYPSAGYVIGASGNAALMALTRAIGGASRDEGIRIVGINPGPIATDRLHLLHRQLAATQGYDPEDESAGLLAKAGKPEDIGSLVAFLASPRAAFINGTIITADGGHRY